MNKKVLSIILASAMALSAFTAVSAAEDVVNENPEIISVQEKGEPTFVKSEELTVKSIKDGVIETEKKNAVKDETAKDETAKGENEIVNGLNNIVELNTYKAVFYKNDGTEIKLEDIKEGDSITAFTRATEPTVLKLPETYTPAVIILNEEGKDVNVTVSTFRKDADTDGYINAEKDLIIFLPEGFTENKRAGNDYIVFYTITTRSIPPQTTPEKLILLEEDEPVTEIPYTDVKADDKFTDSILKATEMGLVNGVSDTEFAPEGNMTRAMFVTVLGRLDGVEPTEGENSFADVVKGSYYAGYVDWAQKNGIVEGYSDTEFAPEQEVTREQMAAILYRYANYKKIETEAAAKNTNILSYNDAQSISEYAVEAMQWACGQDVLVERSEGYINPSDNATRAEAANAVVVLSGLKG